MKVGPHPLAHKEEKGADDAVEMKKFMTSRQDCCFLINLTIGRSRNETPFFG